MSPHGSRASGRCHLQPSPTGTCSLSPVLPGALGRPRSAGSPMALLRALSHCGRPSSDARPSSWSRRACPQSLQGDRRQELPGRCPSGRRSHPLCSSRRAPARGTRTPAINHSSLVLSARQHPVGTMQIHLTFKGPGWRPQGGSAKSLHPRGWASPSSSAPDCPCHRRAESLKRGGTARRQPSLIH